LRLADVVGASGALGLDRRVPPRVVVDLSILRSHIKAMGGELEVIARFPDGAVKTSNFAEPGQSAAS